MEKEREKQEAKEVTVHTGFCLRFAYSLPVSDPQSIMGREVNAL